MDKKVRLKSGVVKLGGSDFLKFSKKRKVKIISGVTALFIAFSGVAIGLSGCGKSNNEKNTKSVSSVRDNKNKAKDKSKEDLIDVSDVSFISPNLSSKNNSTGSYYGKVTGDVDLNKVVVGNDGDLYVDQKSADEAAKIPVGQDKVVTYSTPGVVEGAPNGGVYDSQTSANKIAEAKNNGTYIDPSNVHQDENGDWVLSSSNSYSNEQVIVDNGVGNTVIDNNYGYIQPYVDNTYNNQSYTQPYVNDSYSNPTYQQPNYGNQTYTQTQLYYDNYGNAYFTQEDADAANRAIASDNFYENVNGQYQKVYR